MDKNDHAAMAVRSQRAASMLTVFFNGRELWSWTDGEKADRERYARFLRGLLASRASLLSRFSRLHLCLCLSARHPGWPV